MIDVPDAIIKTVKQGGAHSTHYSAPESAEAFAEKTRSNAEQWKPMADTLLCSLDRKKVKMNRYYIGYLKFRRRFTDGKRLPKENSGKAEAHCVNKASQVDVDSVVRPE
jgi:hypothetical protein